MLVFACLCGCVPRVCSAQGGQELLPKESSGLGSQRAVSCPVGAGRSLTALEELSVFLPTDRLSSTLSPMLLIYNGIQLKLLLFDYLRISSMFSDKFASHPSLNSFFPTVCSRSCLTLFSPPHQVRFVLSK